MAEALVVVEVAAHAVIRGAGGGKGGGGGEALDTVRSTQIADVLDLLSEGEVQGLTNGIKSVLLDGVPLQNPDDTFNFDAVQVVFTPGTQGQASIAGGDGVQTEVAVAVPVLEASPVVRTITNPAVDTCRVTIAIPTLTDTDTGDGTLRGSSFRWAIEVQSDGGGFVEVLQELVEEKITSTYSRSKRFALAGSAPWDIRVKRIGADSTSTYIVNEFVWASYTEIQSLKLRHPNSAMVRLRVNAQAFSRIPTRAYDLMGLRVQVPTNYDPITKVYTGVWDGTFKMAWTDCPPWIHFAVATNERWGLGRYFQTGDALKWQMYALGRYSDEMVPDGKGGEEPRFRCGVEIRTREQAFKLLADLAAIFRGMTYWANDDLAVVQDAPADPVMLYTAANVIDGRFNYPTASRARRPTQVVVWFNDINQTGKLVPELVIDRDAEKRFGSIRPMADLNPLGVWSRAQARRVGLWALYSERYEGGLVEFRVGLDGVLVAPGSVFQIADPRKAGERLGGRVRSATTAAVTLDAPVTLVSGETYTLSVMLQDPADPARLVTQQRAVTTGAGTTSVLAVAPAFTAAPAAQTVWLLQSDVVQATWWRCLQVGEVEGTNDFEVVGLRHYPQKYDLIEQGIEFEPPSVSRISTVPAAPSALDLAANFAAVGGALLSSVSMSCPNPAPGVTLLFSWRMNSGAWTDMPATSDNSVEVANVGIGLFEASLRVRNSLGAMSKTVTATLLVEAPAPADVPDFRIERAFPGGIELRWTKDTRSGMRTELRLNGGSWADGIQLYSGNADSIPYLWPGDGAYVIRARRLDVWGNYSAADATIEFVIAGGIIGGAYIVDPSSGEWERSDGSTTTWLRSIIDPESGATIGYEDVLWEVTGELNLNFPWAINFDLRNDRIATLPEDPTLATDGNAVDHVLKPDGSADVSFEWAWPGDEANIDGFEVLLYASATGGVYTLGTDPAGERVTGVPAYKRAMLAYGLNANSHLTWAVRAYRVVDPDVAAAGILFSAWAVPTATGEVPYQPSANVSFSGDVTGTVGGMPASNASIWDAASTNFDLRNDRLGTTPVAPTIAGGGAAIDHVLKTDGSADLSFEWLWAGDEGSIDGFEVLLYLSSSSSTYTIGTDPSAEQVMSVPASKRAALAYGINPTSHATFAVRAYRVVDPDVAPAGVLRSAWVKSVATGEDPYQAAANAAFAGDVTGTVGGIAAANAAAWEEATTNFDLRNDRLGTTPAAPTIAGGGAAIDHVLKTNGSADLSFEWLWAGDEGSIDGFEVLLYLSSSSSTYTIGTDPSAEQVMAVPASKRAALAYGVNPTSHATFAVRTYRIVDPDVAASGVLRSAWVKSTATGEDPYQAAANAAFAGDVTGTVGGIAATNAAAWDEATTNFDARNDRLSAAISTPTILSDGNAIDHVVNGNGSVDVSFEWSWGGVEADIDGFEVLLRVSTSAGAYTVGTSPEQELVLSMPANKRAMFFLGLHPTNRYTFGVRAYRVVDPDVAAGGRIFSAWVQPSAALEDPYQPSTSVAFAGDLTGTVAGIPAADVNQWDSINGVNVTTGHIAANAATEIFSASAAGPVAYSTIE